MEDTVNLESPEGSCWFSHQNLLSLVSPAGLSTAVNASNIHYNVVDQPNTGLHPDFSFLQSLPGTSGSPDNLTSRLDFESATPLYFCHVLSLDLMYLLLLQILLYTVMVMT